MYESSWESRPGGTRLQVSHARPGFAAGTVSDTKFQPVNAFGVG